MPRPSVDVVVPFRGEAARLDELRGSLARLELRPGDSVLVVDNTPGHGAPHVEDDGGVRVLPAAEIETPAFARNRGAERGRADWLVFFDADTEPYPDLLDRYFEPPPGERTAMVAGGVLDEEVPPDAPPVPRFAYVRGLMSQDNTHRFGTWSFPQTANAACRRIAFEEVGGFRDELRAGEDADLSFRLRAAGWEMERREAARVVHRSRGTVLGLVRQKLLHGAGGAWLDREYPGSIPARRRPGLVWWGVRTAVKGLVAAARRRDRDTALWSVLHPVELIAYEFGRSLNNERPTPGRPRKGRP